MLHYASDILEREWHPSSRNRGPRALPYQPFDSRTQIRDVLSLSDIEQAELDAAANPQDGTAHVSAVCSARMQSEIRREHLATFTDRLVLQKLRLANLQLRARELFDDSLTMCNGQTFGEVLQRAADLLQVGDRLYLDARTSVPLRSYVDCFPPHALRVQKHSLSAAQLHREVDQAACDVQLPRYSIADYKTMFSQMVQQSRAVHEFRHAFTNDRSLFRSCFGFFPEGEIQIIQGPLSLYFRLFAPEDYAKVFAGQRNGDKASAMQLARASLTDGALLHYAALPEQVRGAITVENNRHERLFVGERVTIFQHEEDHVIHQFFTAPWMHAPSTFPVNRLSPDTTPAPQLYRQAIADSLGISCALRVFPRCKDEILAQFNDDRSIAYIEQVLAETGAAALYDFAGQERDEIRRTQAMRYAPREVGMLVRAHLRERYQRVLTGALESLQELEAAGLERPVITELLRIEPLQKWPRLARMVAQQL